MNKFMIKLLIVVAGLIIGCYTTSWENNNSPITVNNKIRYQNIFPLAESGKSWEYFDEDGNKFEINVIDTIYDESNLYHKVEFKEMKLAMVQNDWFIKEVDGIKYNNELKGIFNMFLPSTLYRNGGFFNCDTINIQYDILPSLIVGDTVFTDVLKLSYATAVLHGFDEIYFADNVGIIRMVDFDGRWPVDYKIK